MFAQIKRLMLALVLALAPLTFSSAPGRAPAAEPDRQMIRKGVYQGIWHTDPVTIIIEKVDVDGKFTGEIHFDPNGRWGDVRAPFTAWLGRDDTVTMTRDDCPQTARTGRPEQRGRALVWKGQVRGEDFTSTFELCIPLRR